MTLARPRALCFDLDATLLDPGGALGAIIDTCETVAAAFPALDAERLRAANAEAWQSYWPTVMNAWTLGELSGHALTREAWRRTLEACDCHDPVCAKFAWQTHQRLAAAAHRLYDDVRGLVVTLKARLPLALITNGASDTQRTKLRTLAIEPWFRAVVISGEARAAKPDAVVFEQALGRLGLEAHQVWHVGDNLITDVGGARAAGLTAVWLNRHGRERAPDEPEPHLEIRSLTELWALIEGG